LRVNPSGCVTRLAGLFAFAKPFGFFRYFLDLHDVTSLFMMGIRVHLVDISFIHILNIAQFLPWQDIRVKQIEFQVLQGSGAAFFDEG
jgi:hypothetical protein